MWHDKTNPVDAQRRCVYSEGVKCIIQISTRRHCIVTLHLLPPVPHWESDNINQVF